MHAGYVDSYARPGKPDRSVVPYDWARVGHEMAEFRDHLASWLFGAEACLSYEGPMTSCLCGVSAYSSCQHSILGSISRRLREACRSSRPTSCSTAART
jgi:hypothetical protein